MLKEGSLWRTHYTEATTKECVMWGCYNFNTLLGVRHLKKEAIALAKSLGPWDEIKNYIQIRKVTVTARW